mgnify:CR=1 FL=1
MNNDQMQSVNYSIPSSVIHFQHFLVYKYPTSIMINLICKMKENDVTSKKIMCRLLFCVLVLFFNILISNAQTLNTYSGKYKYGTATYTYRDNPEGGRIYEGNFVYVGNNGIDKAIGKFKNDKKEGVWSYTNLGFMKSLPALKATYKNGILDGSYQYTSKSECISLTISKGKFIGNVNGKNLSFSYQKGISNYITTLKLLKGQFDEDGYCDGKWILQQDDIINFYGIYEHGVCRKFYREDLTTGDIENVVGDISHMLNMIIENNYKSLECMIERNNVEWKWWYVEKETQTVAEENNESQELFEVADEMPEFPGGTAAMMEYLNKHINYPTTALENGIKGRVTVSCIINENGSISDIKVISSVDTDLDKEAIRVVQSMPKWKPGKLNGKNVRVRYIIPIMFRF